VTYTSFTSGAVWKGLNAEYKAALSCFTFLGSHSSNFYEFCNKQQDFYYSRKYLESKPFLFSTVFADLAEDTFMESIEVAEKPPSNQTLLTNL